MTSSQLSPPGSAHYSSSTLHVGDGTWDGSRDDFLLPNIQGLNFATMRYNGMGNRFRGLPEYSTIIIAHGTIAIITFLFLVPAAILIASFYHRNPRLALRLHISLQTLTVILSTIVFVLGYFAVGPARSLTNPHHGIGVAIYVLVLYQALSGWLIHKIEKGKMRYHIPIKLMLHQWIGRATALLAIAQIPIGLTLYGSPEWLFIVYALVMAVYVVLYFIFTYENHKRLAGVYDDVSQTDGTDVSRRHHRFGLGSLAGAAAGGAGLAALTRRFSGRRRNQAGVADSGISSRPTSGDSYYDEKYGNDGRTRNHSFRDRMVEGALGIGGVAAMKNWYDRRRGRDETVEVENYRPPLGGPVNPSQSGVDSSVVHMNRVEEGYGPPPGPTNPYGQGYNQGDRWQEIEQREAGQTVSGPPGPRHDVRFATQSELHGTEQSYDSREDGRGGRFFRGLAGAGAGFGLGEWWRRRRDKKDQERIAEHRQHEEESQAMFGTPNTPNRYTGDGTPRRNGQLSPTPHRTGSPEPVRTSTFRGPMDRISTQNTSSAQLPPPRPFDLHPPPQNIPMPNIFPPQSSTFSGPPPPMQMNRAPMEAQQSQPVYNNNITNTIRNNTNPPITTTIPPPGQTTTTTLPIPPQSNIATSATRANPTLGAGDSPDSLPVSVKVKMHNDGRHVTLRRLNEAEAAAERDRRRASTNRRGSFNSEASSNPQRYRRGFPPPTMGNLGAASTPLYPPQQPFAPRAQQTPSPMNLASPQPGPAPPPLVAPSPPSAAAYDTGTDLSNPAFDENRRRRRAERARLAATKGAVDYT